MRKFLLFVLMLCCLACSKFFAQTTEYPYQFTEKLRTNIDNLISMGLKDTCGVIEFYYEIGLSDGDGALVFRVENDCSPAIDFSKLLPQGKYLEVIISDKYEALIDSKPVEQENISNAVNAYLKKESVEEEDTVVMLRVDRSCKNTEKINAILNAIHMGAVAEGMFYSLIYDLGKSSRAEPPKIEMYIDEED